MYQIAVYIPASFLEIVRDEMFKAGGGAIGDYDCCCFVTKGVGTFRPLDGSKPFIGEKGRLVEVEEYKLEMVCKDELFENVISAMLKSHPYETPAYNYFHFI